MKLKLVSIFLLFIAGTSLAQTWETGKTYYDEEKWTEFIVGNMPLVISVPHGGSTLLLDMPTRDCPGAVTVTDSRTIELAREMQKAFKSKYGLSPYIVICHLSRKDVDQNREIETGTCGNERMRKPWNQFHNYIDTALALAVKKYGSTLYIDLHGHGHPNQRLELGYGINGDELPKLTGNKDLSEMAKRSSLQNLLLLNKKADFRELMVGENAFGTLITNEGSPAIPGKQVNYLKEGEKYFNGGYNTRRYTSDQYPFVFGWQIESNYKGVRDPEGRPVFAKAFADVIIQYIKKNTMIQLPQ